MTAADGMQRKALVEYGKGFHIRHANISFTKAALAKLSPWFSCSNIDLACIRTLSELRTAYLAWQPPAEAPAGKLLALRLGTGCIPKHASGPERLERQLLLTYAPYIDIEHADILLNADGCAAVADACNTLGIAPQSITTLIKLAQLNHDFARQAIHAVMPQSGSAAPRTQPNARAGGAR